jgi:hypothetical protein
MSPRRESTNRGARALLAASALATIATSAVIAVRAVQDGAQQPPSIVSADENSVVLRSVEDASVIRTLATGRDARDVQRVVVSPDGELVYYSRGWPRRCPNWDEGIEEEVVTRTTQRSSAFPAAVVTSSTSHGNKTPRRRSDSSLMTS